MYIRFSILLFLVSVIASGQDIGGQYYVAHPDSTYSGMNTASDSNNGSYLNPWATWQKAFEVADKRDTVYFRDGTWEATAMHPEVNSALVIDPYGQVTDGVGNDGAEDSIIVYMAYPGETPIFDGANIANSNRWYQGLDLERCNFVEFNGLTIRNIRQGVPCTLHGVNGYGCSNITFRNFTLSHIGGKGFSLNGNFGNPTYFPEQSDLDTNAMRFINCDVSYCMDSLTRNVGSTDTGNYADGYWMIDTDTLTTSFAFDSCRSFMNSDDGWDVPHGGWVGYNMCWSFDNGHLVAGIGEGIRHAATNRGAIASGKLTRCIMARNRQNGYRAGYGGSENLQEYVYNNLTYLNGESGYVISKNRYDDPVKPIARNTYRNNISLNDNVYQIFRGSATPPLYPNLAGLYAHSNNNWTVGYNMSGALPDITPTVTLDSSDFLSLDVDELYTARQSDGSLPNINFGRPAEGSPVIDVGVADTLFTQLDLTYYGDFPDLGAFEYGAQTDVDSIHINTIGGVTTITVDDGQLQFYDTIWPVDATYQNVNWSVSNVTGQATIDQSGLVTATADGTVDVIGTSQDGTGVADTVRITISNQVNPIVPTVTTTIATGTFNVYSYCGGVVTSDGGGTVTARGVCWGTSLNPTLGTSNYTTEGTGTGAFSSFVSSLKPNTTYYIRAYATNSEGTAYGENRQTTTIPVKYKSVGNGSNVYYNGNKKSSSRLIFNE